MVYLSLPPGKYVLYDAHFASDQKLDSFLRDQKLDSFLHLRRHWDVRGVSPRSDSMIATDPFRPIGRAAARNAYCQQCQSAPRARASVPVLHYSHKYTGGSPSRLSGTTPLHGAGGVAKGVRPGNVPGSDFDHAHPCNEAHVPSSPISSHVPLASGSPTTDCHPLGMILDCVHARRREPTVLRARTTLVRP